MVTPEDQNNNNKICNACQPRGICPECHRAVVGRDAYVEHGTRFWHKDCFRCRTCAAFIGDTPVVDLQGSPCCESCMMAQAPPTPISPTSTLSSLGDMPDSLPSSLSSLPWLSKRQQQQHPLRSRPRLDSSLFQKETTLPHQDVSPLSNPSPVLGLSRSYSPVSPRPAGHTPTATKSTQQFSDELCRACAKPVARPCVRLGTFWYHHECLRCDACQGYFNDSEVVHDGQHMYHPKCRRPSPPSGFKCDECKKPITQHLVKHSGRVVHPECFRCFGCHNTLSCNQPYVEIDKQAYCQPCSLQEQQCTPAPAPPVMESNMFTHRSRRAPPKLGGPKICPRCRLSISFMDEIPGPRASRWHKKCLRCQGCQKQMDSGAKIAPWVAKPGLFVNDSL
ncbi:hypothetical protein DFQ28_006847 [Apophysomyces sp. BC1034]|nr:hypothetical protein DFQ28_006847 [Apophysomyces sp. BC1034]